MAARGGAVFQQQEQQNRGGVKAKAAVPGEARNRRALQDIGNLAKTQALLEGKPQIATRPLTRNFASQLLRKAQEGAEKTKVALVPEAIKINAAREAKVAVVEAIKINAAREAKVAVVPEAIKIDAAREARVAVIEKKVLTIRHEEVKNKKPKDEIKTLTSLLTARSKVVCGELANQKPKVQHIQNIDESDIGNEFAEIEYVDDIYNYYKVTEDENRVGDYLCLQPDINVKMRAILIDWLIEVHNKFELTPETLYLTVNIVDRYLMMKTVARRELQLVGMSAMLIACKYEEIWAPEVNDFVCISDQAYAREQVLVMEKLILGKLEWYLTVPTPYVFLVRYIKASVQPDSEMENLVFFLAELGIVQYSCVLKYRPSVIAAAAVYAARCTLNKRPFWSETLQHYTGYSEEQIIDCAKLLVSFHAAAPESKLRAVYRKYLHSERGAVSITTPAKMLLEPKPAITAT